MSLDNDVMTRELKAIKAQLEDLTRELKAIKAQLKNSDESRRKETERLYKEFGKKYGRAYKQSDDEPKTQF